MITPEEIKRLREIYKASLPQEPWGDTSDFWITNQHKDKNGEYHNTSIWYGDGDQCAEVYDNLGIYSPENIAECFVEARKALPKLLEEIEELRKRNEELNEMLNKINMNKDLISCGLAWGGLTAKRNKTVKKRTVQV